MILKSSATITTLVKERHLSPKKGNFVVDNKPVLDLLKTHQYQLDRQLTNILTRLSEVEKLSSQLKRNAKLRHQLENLTTQIRRMSDEHSCTCAEEIDGLKREIQDLKHDWCRHAITSSQEVTGLKQSVIKAEATNNRLSEDILNELHEIIPKQIFESVKSITNGLSGIATVHTENMDADDTTSNRAGDNITRNYQPSEPAQPVRRIAGLDRYEGQMRKVLLISD